jgi:hypothetical protein
VPHPSESRRDVSSFVVHFTRDLADATAIENLESILSSGRIEARNPFGFAKTAANRSPNIAVSQRVVCFSETPLSEVAALVAPIEGRRNPLAPFGLAFRKTRVRDRGVNPVWYFEVGGVVEGALQALFAQAFGPTPVAAPHPAMSIFPYCESMGRLPNGRSKEFAWEREWRHTGDFVFDLDDVALVFAPTGDHARLRDRFGRPCVAAQWSGDRMLSAILGERARRTETPTVSIERLRQIGSST